MSSQDRSIVVISANDLERLAISLLTAAGCSSENAVCAARVFIEADLCRPGGQGIDFLPCMINDLKNGKIDPSAEPSVVHECAATALIEGRRGPGPRAAMLATELAIRKARTAGAAVIGVTNSTDIFMIGYYADLIAREGLASIVFTSGPPLVHPYGGTERVLSTNPIAFAFPTDREARIICDVSTSAISGWRLQQAAYYDEQLPLGSGIDREGKPTRDAKAIVQGAISPLGEHKGFALGLAVAVMSGLLNGSQVGRALVGWQTEGPVGYLGHTFIAVDPKGLNPVADFPKAVGGYIDEIKRSRKTPNQPEIMIPGERLYRARKKHLESGVPVFHDTWDAVAKIGVEFGVQMPKPIKVG
jgi:ureidoglycolate dehydrogenase (NAD+)